MTRVVPIKRFPRFHERAGGPVSLERVVLAVSELAPISVRIDPRLLLKSLRDRRSAGTFRPVRGGCALGSGEGRAGS